MLRVLYVGFVGSLVLVSTLNGKWIDVFRAGNYGEKGTYTPAMLAQMCASYDPAKDEVPFTKGHPSHDGPAFGWVKGLRLEGDVVQALPGEVDPEFDGAVQAGRFKKRSVAFKQNADGSLKLPIELRHIGFLGAMLPGVKGLRDPKFADEKFSEIEFSEGEVMDQEQLNKSIGESIKAYFAEMFGGKKTNDSGITQSELDAAVQRATSTVAAQFTAELKAEREAREAIATQFAEHQRNTGATTASVRAASLIQGLKDKKRWVPAYDKMGVPAMFAALASSAAVEITFGEGSEQKKVDAAQLFSDILSGLGSIVPEGVVFTADGKLQAPAEAPSANGGVVHAGSIAFHEAVTARSKEKSIPYGDAYKQLTSEGKSSDTYGGATAGAV